jgi:hypothetical protein
MPGCTFVFKEKIDGESKVSIRAAGGTIDFPNRHNIFGDGGSKIDGKSKVLLEAETIKFNAKVDGKSVVLIIISKGGTLELLETNGQAEVYWCKADPKDPAPTVKPGKIDNAKVKQVEREEMDKLVKQHGLK